MNGDPVGYKAIVGNSVVPVHTLNDLAWELAKARRAGKPFEACARITFSRDRELDEAEWAYVEDDAANL